MAHNYSVKQFFIQMPNASLARYFKTKGLFSDLNFEGMNEGKPDELFAAWSDLPDKHSNAMVAMFRELFEMSCEKGVEAVIDEAEFQLDEEGFTALMDKMSALPPSKQAGESQQALTERQIPPQLAALSGGDPVLERQIERVSRLVNSPISILLTGETGCGKEYFAKALHDSSQRRTSPFVAVNCAAIPETLIESELFGYVPGSFSGAATKGRRGLIQQADGGTLFLDEIGDMPKPLQSRLLRVLSEKEVLPVGATRPIQVNIRVISATHCDLETMVLDGAFRDDLYYRLSGANITLPSVRDRQDIAWLIYHMLHLYGQQSTDRKVPKLSHETMAILLLHSWPGNTREMRNVIEYATAVCDDNLVTPNDLPDYLTKTEIRVAEPVKSSKIVPEAADLLFSLRAYRWNISATATGMKISRVTLYRRMKLYGVTQPNHLDQ